jgi:RNA-directed DNA polymerase
MPCVVKSEGQVLSDSIGDLELEDIQVDPIFWLATAHSVKDVAHALDMDPERFFFVVRHANDGFYYKQFSIPKKRGGVRLISAPKQGLAIAQTRLAAILSSNYRPKPFVRGFVKGQSFLSNAQSHERQRWILNVDIEGFYPSINFARVRGLFMSSLFGFNERVATILARITTTSNGLPQGARTSPVIANLIAYNLDKKLVNMARALRLQYTRYADDITFSSSQKAVPSLLVQSWEPGFGDREIQLGRELLEAFETSGFSINHQKTRLLFQYERQEVTGLIVNRQANVWRKDISRFRMILHSAKVHGSEKAAKLWVGPEATPAQYWQFICGWLAYFAQVRGRGDPVVAKLCKQAVLSGLKGPEWIMKSADMVREFDVFLSHASEDKDRLRKLRDRLVEIGISVFFDEDSISWGDSIVEKINHGLLKSNFFMPFLSENFARKGWTNKELNSAIAMNISRKGRILPLKDFGFSIEDNYPLLNETLYKEWPSTGDDGTFIHDVADEILRRVEAEKLRSHDLS